MFMFLPLFLPPLPESFLRLRNLQEKKVKRRRWIESKSKSESESESESKSESIRESESKKVDDAKGTRDHLHRSIAICHVTARVCYYNYKYLFHFSCDHILSRHVLLQSMNNRVSGVKPEEQKPAEQKTAEQKTAE